MLDQLVAAARGLVNAFAERNLPHEIPVKFPKQSILAGHEAGRYLLSRDEDGSFRYEFNALEPTGLEKARASLVVAHKFGDLGGLAAYLDGAAGNAKVFVDTLPTQAASLRAVLDESAPEDGAVSAAFQRHPTFVRWWEALGKRDTIDLSHQQLADLLLDSAEDLADPTLARVLAAFRAAKTIGYDGNFDANGGMTVSVKWDGKPDVAGTAMSVPRDFVVKIPPYIGAWEPEQEPRLHAVFRLRVLPPKDAGDAAPKFRLRWANLPEWEQYATATLFTRVRDVIGEQHAVYLGVPEVTKYVLPERAE